MAACARRWDPLVARGGTAGLLGVCTVDRTGDSPEAPRAAGVAVVPGAVRSTGPDSAEIRGPHDTAPVRFRQALASAGSYPAVPPIPGLAEPVR